MLPLPHIPLLRLMQALPVDYPLDNYPDPWSVIFTTLQSTPPLPEVRAEIFKAAIASLSDADLQRLEGHLNDPLTFAHYLNVSGPQTRLLHALEELAPIQVTPLARHLNRDYANTFRALQKLVSLGLVTRRKDGIRVYYHLAEPQPSLASSSLKLTANGL